MCLKPFTLKSIRPNVNVVLITFKELGFCVICNFSDDQRVIWFQSGLAKNWILVRSLNAAKTADLDVTQVNYENKTNLTKVLLPVLRGLPGSSDP